MPLKKFIPDYSYICVYAPPRYLNVVTTSVSYSMLNSASPTSRRNQVKGTALRKSKTEIHWTLKAHIHPKCIELRARQIWISCDTKLSKNCDLLSFSFFITIGSCTYILIRPCKYVPSLSFHSFPVLFCLYSVYIYKISRLKLTSTWRDGGLCEEVECVQPIRSCV